MNTLKLFLLSSSIAFIIGITLVSFTQNELPISLPTTINHIATIDKTKIYEVRGTSGQTYIFALNTLNQQISISK